MQIESTFSNVLENFNINKVNRVIQIKNGTANKNYIVEAKEDKFVIRNRSRKYSSYEQMIFEAEYLNYVSCKGIPVPVPLKSSTGLYWHEQDEYVYQLYPFIDGIECDNKDDRQVLAAGEFLGKLHSAVRDFKPLHERKLPRYDDPYVIMKGILRVSDDNEGKMNNYQTETIKRMICNAGLLMKCFPDKVYYNCLPLLIIHGDFHPANVKYSGGKINGLFDFDWISSQPRMRDVIDGIIYFSSRRSKSIAGEDILSLINGYIPDLKRAFSFIEAYCLNADTPLTFTEIDSACYFMMARLMHSRVQALAKVPANRHADILTTGMDSIMNWVEFNSCELTKNIKAILN